MSAMPSRRRHERVSPSKPVTPPPDQLWALAWSEGKGTRILTTLDGLAKAYREPGCRVWIDLESPGPDVLQPLSKLLGMHPLIAEDILERNQRAKIEKTGDAIHLVMFALEYRGEIVPHELDMVLGERFLLTA